MARGRGSGINELGQRFEPLGSFAGIALWAIPLRNSI